MGDKPVYAFPVEFEENVVRLLLHDRAFLLGSRKAIDADYFQDPELRWIAASTLKVFDESRGHPTVGSILTEVSTKAPPGIVVGHAVRRTRRLFKAGLSEDAAYVREKVITFGKHQRLLAVTAAAGSYLEAGDYDKYVADIEEANTLTYEKADLFYDYYAEAEKRIEGYEETLKNCVPTGIAEVDQHLQGGGLGPGEMGIVMGLPGFHKTTTLCNIGFAAMKRGLSVFHATFEVSALKTSRRYDCRMSGFSLAETLVRRRKAKKRIDRFKEKTGSKLLVKWWPGRVCTIRELEATMRLLEASRGFRPDIILADYVAKMAPEGKYDSRMSRMAIGEMYADFRSLGGMLGIPVWSAIQSNRDGFNKKDEDEVISQENAAESFEPIREADVVLTLNQTKVEREQGIMRIHGAKVRDDAAFWTESVAIKMDRYTISPLELDEKPVLLNGEDDEPEAEERKVYVPRFAAPPRRP